MRSSQKNRNSRNKGGRNKSSGNVLNRVYESAGPEGKVRGTPQQVIDKYLLLARDAQTSGDRVMAENFLQHAEHYIRLLNSAMPQQTEDRRQPYMNGGQGEHGEMSAEAADTGGEGHDADHAPQEEARRDDDAPPRREVRDEHSSPDKAAKPPASSALETIDVDDGAETAVVETPESANAAEPQAEAEEPKPKPRRRTRRPRNPDEVAAE
jgi:hypothetical protein